jgi:DNA-directed RNA polymerase specialized sigma24 family protein
VSPLPLRRYRAERLLRQQFAGLRGRVLGTVSRRLASVGVRLDPIDLDGCYAQAWQGLYAAMLDGQEITNPAGWLVLVTFRRAIEEHRSRARTPAQDAGWLGADGEPDVTEEHDFAAELDDRLRLRQLVHGMRGRLDAREREAAALCYLHGLSRAQAAARMGISEARMRKLMDGRAPGRPGVAGKVGALVRTIQDGGWCEEQASLMRALAYGILDPAGERYQLAVMHRRDCPACRTYVASLRGLAVALPPVLSPLALFGGSGAAAGGLAGAGGHLGGAHVGGALSSGGGTAGGSVGGAAAGSSGAGAAGGAGGGFFVLGGPVGAKLALACALALGIGAGCAALLHTPGHGERMAHRRAGARVVAPVVEATPPRQAGRGSRALASAVLVRPARRAHASAVRVERGPASAGAQSGREFTPEQAAAPTTAAPPAQPSAAEREFSPG